MDAESEGQNHSGLSDRAVWLRFVLRRVSTVREYNLKDMAAEIRCPMLVTDPESEQSSQASPGNCELNAPGYRDSRIYNWLDETLHDERLERHSFD
jgi:hypothetical protein